ncbi:MAG: hypothetical protein K9K37_11240 [Desulfocapsa sp.]|nr:hypothetical protein [Desulfocapsa sp.]
MESYNEYSKKHAEKRKPAVEAEKVLSTRDERNRRKHRERLTGHGRPQHVADLQHIEGKELNGVLSYGAERLAHIGIKAINTPTANPPTMPLGELPALISHLKTGHIFSNIHLDERVIFFLLILEKFTPGQITIDYES